MEWFYGHYAGAGTTPGPAPLPAPRRDLAGLPPAVIVTAEFDPLRDEGEAYAEALRRPACRRRARATTGMIHGFFDMGTISPAAQQAIDESCERFGRLLRS